MHTTHHHAQVIGLHDDSHTHRLEHVHERVRNLVGHALLQLEAARKHVDYPRKLRQADDSTVRVICDVCLAEERQHVMLAQRVHLDVAYEDHAFVFLFEHGIADNIFHRFAVSAGQPPQRLGDSGGGPQQPFASGIFTQMRQHQADEFLELEFSTGTRDRRAGFGHQSSVIKSWVARHICLLRAALWIPWRTLQNATAYVLGLSGPPGLFEDEVERYFA